MAAMVPACPYAPSDRFPSKGGVQSWEGTPMVISHLNEDTSAGTNVAAAAAAVAAAAVAAAAHQ